MPAQQAILNRVREVQFKRRNGGDSHRVYCSGRWIGIKGQIDRVGVTPVLVMQASTLLLAALMTLRIAPESDWDSHNNKSP